MLMHSQHISCVRLFVTPWTGPHQSPLFMEFSKQEYWSISYSNKKVALEKVLKFVFHESNIFKVILANFALKESLQSNKV